MKSFIMGELKEKKGHSFLDIAYQMYKSMKTNDINLVYEGEVTQEITKTFTSLTEKSLAKSQESNMVQRKVFQIMVECLQNISKHADPFEGEEEKRCIVMVSHGKESYSIITGNVIMNEKIPALKESLEKVKSLSKEELSALYKKQMRDSSISEKGGAGLGLIDIAKKTGSNLNYQFKELNDNLSFFILTSTVERK